MKKRILSILLAAALCMGLATVPAFAAGVTAQKTSNIGRNNYDGNWAADIHSLLYENSQGGLTRVEYYQSGSSSKISVIVETYDSGFQVLSSKKIDLPSEIDRFGGAFHGEKYNYLIVGHDNRSTESKSTEVMRVIQYDQDWNELASVGFTSGETNMVIPFGHGLHCVEAGDYLHIHSDRYMGKWMTNDGQNHQTSLYVTVKQSDMSAHVITESINNPVHVSHSFAQYILVNDEGKIVMANHGDAYPRAFRLSVLPGSAESADPTADGRVTKLDVEEFMEAADPNEMAAVNQTDAELGGLVEVGDAYVMAYKTITTRYNIPLRGDYQNIYMARIPKDDLSAGAVQKIKLTDESMWIDSKNADKKDGDLFSGTPVLVPTGENTGYLMWTNQRYTTLGGGFFSGFFEKSVTDQMFILPYDATTSETFAASLAKKPIELKGNLSDCQPFVYNGKVVWYTTGQFKSQKSTMSTRTGCETTPVFYVFDGKSITAYQDGEQVTVPDAFYSKTSTKPNQPDESNKPSEPATPVKESLGLTQTDPNVQILPLDNIEVQTARDFVESRLGSEDYGVFGNDATADSVLQAAQNMLTRQKNQARVSWGANGFSLTPATPTKDGKITGNLFFTCGTAKCGLALDLVVKYKEAEKPAEEQHPTLPSTGTAYPSTQTVELDGKKVTFQMYALKDANGNDTNYVKVRDLALALNNTRAKFSVDWNGAVNLVAGASYVPNGSENQTPFLGHQRTYTLPAKPTNVNGSASDLVAITLVDDAGGGYTYYQLRDLGRKLGFNVSWSAARGVFIETDKPYTGK